MTQQSPTYTQYNAPHSFPHIKGLPLIGVTPQLIQNPLHFLVLTMIHHGGFARLSLIGKSEMWVASHPQAVQHIFQENYKNYIKGYDSVRTILGNGLVASEGSLWLRQRRLMQPAFHHRQIAGLIAAMEDETHAMLTRWEGAAHSGETLDIAHEFLRLTLRIIVRTMFGASLTEQEIRAVSHAFTITLEYLNNSQFFSIPQHIPTPTNLRYQRAIAYINALVYRMINDRRKKTEPGSDLLGMLIAAQDSDTGERMSDEQIRDEVTTIFLAGHETTASLLAWMTYLLSLHPIVERRLHSESQSLLNGRAPTAAEINQLPYMRMVIDETLRLYPPAWMVARTAIADDEILGYTIPKGQRIVISPYLTHHDPTWWENPEGFDPERFAPENETERPRFAYYPFAGGPRICIGNTFSLTEATLIMSMIVQRFQLTLAPGYPVKPIAHATLRPGPNVWMHIKNR